LYHLEICYKFRNCKIKLTQFDEITYLTINLINDKSDLEMSIFALGFLKRLSEDEPTSYKLIQNNILDKLFEFILFFQKEPLNLITPFRILQNLSIGNNIIIDLMINKKISEILEKLINIYQNSVNKDSNPLLIEIYFLLGNLVAGFQSQADHFVYNTNLIKNLFHIFKFKKNNSKLVLELLMVIRNVILNSSKAATYELIKLKVFDFLAEILYSTHDTETILAGLDCIGGLFVKLEESFSHFKETEVLFTKLENYRLHTHEEISEKAELILNRFTNDSSNDIII
jgi:hypothetical protein